MPKPVHWRSWLIIALVAFLAHGLCLRADFYLDDRLHILDRPEVTEHFDPLGAPDIFVTSSVYYAIHHIFGPSRLAFHALNLLMHIAVAIALFELAMMWFPRFGFDETSVRRAALWGAILFACHPLGTEITNYARCTDLEWVMLFSLIAAMAGLRWLDGSWKWFAAMLAAIALARFSKGPGVWHALSIAGIVVASVSSPATFRRFVSNKSSRFVSGASLLAVLIAAATQFPKWKGLLVAKLHEGRFGWHLLTQSRVAWEYFRRMVWPTDLCSDHHIAWTMSLSDTGAWTAAAALVLFTGLSIWMFFRKSTRLYGALPCLVLFPILLRFPFVSSELMVEYRTYPALPFVGLLGGLALAQFARRRQSAATAVLVAVTAVFVVFSARRSTVWHSAYSINHDVLRQYPTRLRAVWELMRLDYMAGRYQAVLDRQPLMNETARRLQAFNRKAPDGRQYDLHHFAYSDISCRCFLARALSRTGHPRQATRLFELIRTRLIEANHLKDPFSLGAYHYHRGAFLLESGHPARALEELRKAKKYSEVMEPVRQTLHKAYVAAMKSPGKE
jgi:hypothetical protein